MKMFYEKDTDVNLIKDIPIGSIIAATVCSPINEDKMADIARKPKTIFEVLLPVNFNIPRAILESHPCLIITTASINEPIIKNTASLIKALAMPSAESMPPYTWASKIYIAIAGKGIGSLIININDVTKIIIAV